MSIGYSTPAGVGFSARDAYPTFLSPQESALLQLQAAGRGLFDAFRWDVVVRLAARYVSLSLRRRHALIQDGVARSDAEVRSNVFKSLLVNLLSLTSVYFFDLLLMPLTKEHEHWLRRNVGWFYQMLWLFPVVGISLYLNVSTSVCLDSSTSLQRVYSYARS